MLGLNFDGRLTYQIDLCMLAAPIHMEEPMRGYHHKTQSENELVTLLIARDAKALEELYASYSVALLGVISRTVKQQDLAEDILQESFLKIWTSIEKYDPEKGRLFTWMARLVTNKAIDHLRSRCESKTLKNEDLSCRTVEINARYQIWFHPEFIGIKQLLNSLSPEQTTIINMVYFQGYTQVEVGEILNIPLGTIKTRIRASIRTLRSYF